jgi:F-type H+-transporting ATPase subunit epsilon
VADDQHKLSVEVLTPEGEVFSGEVEQVSTRTAVGEIGILANHVPILAALQPTELRLHVSGSEVERYAQAHGWLQVFANHAQLLVEEAVPPDQLDAGRLREQLEDAEQRLSEAEAGSAANERAAKDRQRVETFLELAEGSGQA